MEGREKIFHLETTRMGASTGTFGLHDDSECTMKVLHILEIIEKVKKSGKPNYEQCRIPVNENWN